MYETVAEYFDEVSRTPCPKGHTTNLECTTALVARYLDSFTGACFDPRMDEPWWEPYRFNSADVYGVAALSMGHMIRTSVLNDLNELFDSDAQAARAAKCPGDCTTHQTCLLRQIPPDATILHPSAEDYLRLANQLRLNLNNENVRGVDVVGWNKLIAHKRPHIVPVLDRVSKEGLRLRNNVARSYNYWEVFRTELNPRTPELKTALTTVRAKAKVPKWTSDIRVIDIAIWMDEMNHC